MHTRLIAITGGIGAGKSVLCRVLRSLGYEVFDCDSEAKALMDSDSNIKERIAAEVDTASIMADGSIDRARLAAKVFTDKAALERLNTIVHGAVRARIEQWRASRTADVAFIETAILYQSGLNGVVDAEWRVVAPDELRVTRVMARNGVSREAVQSRIAAQYYEPSSDEPCPPMTEFNNDGKESLLKQLNKVIKM